MIKGGQMLNCRNKKLLFLIGLLLLPAAVWAAQKSGGVNFGLNYGNAGIEDFRVPWYLSRGGQHFFSALSGAILGAFFSQKMRKFRKWIFIALVVGCAVAAVLMSVFLGNVAFFVLGAAAAYYLLRETVKAVGKAWDKRGKKQKLSTFGSAEWADLEHLQEHKLIGKKGFNLGVYVENGISHPIHYTGERHLLTVAPTRSGKGVSSIVPNLLTYEGSVIVIDPKGENAKVTAPRRGAGDQAKNIPGIGQKVHVVDPWFITGLPCSCFNPIDWLQPNDPDINENAMMLADSIVTPHEGNRDQFWDEEAKALLMGLLLHVALDAEEQQNRNLGRVRDIICMGTDDLNEVFKLMMASPNPIVSSTAYRTISKEEKLKSNVLASLQAHTHFLDSPRIRANLGKSDFKFEDLKTTKMTIYLVLPADRLETFGRWLRLLIQQALTVNARNIEEETKPPVLFLLDEMAALGRLTMVEQAYSLMAGFGMQLWGIIQDLSQLDRIYDKGWQTFIGNSGVLQYFGSRDHKTADYFSKLCGVTTIEKFSVARTLANAFGRSWSSSSTMNYGQGSGSSTSGSGGNITDTISRADTIDVVQRHLIFPDELMVLREKKQLVLIESCNPIPAKRIIWFEDETLKPLGVDLKSKPVAPAAIAATKASLERAAPKHSYSPPVPKPPINPVVATFKSPAIIKLKTETYEKAKQAAPDLDVYDVEKKWRKWLDKKGERPKNPDAAFIGFCRRVAQTVGSGATQGED